MCDLIVAGDTARLGQPEVNLGIIPGAGGTQRWPRTAGKHVAMEVMLTGAPVTAQRAYELGIVNKVVPAEMTIEVAKRIARELAAKPPLAVRLAKEAVLTGGPKVFAAGADIQDMAKQTAVDQLLRDQTGRWAPLAGFKKPLIAAVNGYALGGGCEVALM